MSKVQRYVLLVAHFLLAVLSNKLKSIKIHSHEGESNYRISNGFLLFKKTLLQDEVLVV